MDILEATIAAKTNKTLTAVLDLMVARMENGETLTGDEMLVHAKLCEEVETRNPRIEASLDAWLEQDYPGTKFYGRAILNALAA